MYEKEVSLEKLVNINTRAIACLINDKCFYISSDVDMIDFEQEDAILNELNEERTRFWRPVHGILDKVLDNGGKLFFNLTNDEGVFVIRKRPCKNDSLLERKIHKDVSQVGKLTRDGEEILLDKESDKDIYEDVHVFKPRFNSISEVYEEIKDKRINLDKTIGRASADIFGGYIPNVEVLCDHSEIYIRAIQIFEKPYTEGTIYEYELDDDDFTNVIIYSALGTSTLRLSSQYYTGDEDGDYGIRVTDDGVIEFYENASGLCGGLKELCDLSEPLKAFIVELLMELLVFEDPASDEVMYCPECEKEHYNGEKTCTDCGTELITSLEFYMLVEFGDY